MKVDGNAIPDDGAIRLGRESERCKSERDKEKLFDRSRFSQWLHAFFCRSFFSPCSLCSFVAFSSRHY